MDFENKQKHRNEMSQISNDNNWWTPVEAEVRDNVNFSYEESYARKVVNKSMAWMCFALLLSALSAWFVGHSERTQAVLFTGYTPFILFGAEILMVVMLGAAINKISASTATLLFVLFSLVNGASLGTIFLCYAEASIFMVFGLTALIFGGMALYGYTTSSDLTKYSTLFMFGLIGIIVVSLINFFLNSPMLYTAISAFGVLLFIGLTAYDVQMIKRYAVMAVDEESTTKLAVLGAMELYLDFINLFIYLLRLLGSRRD